MSTHLYLDYEDPLDAARWLAEKGADPLESTAYTLIDIAESLRHITARPHRKDTMTDTDPTLTLLRELQCRVDDLAARVAHLAERIEKPSSGGA
jgi:hypothetical protein